MSSLRPASGRPRSLMELDDGAGYRLVVEEITSGALTRQRRSHHRFAIIFQQIGAPGAIRTRDLSLRRRILYPAELRAHCTGWRYYSPRPTCVQSAPRAAARPSTVRLLRIENHLRAAEQRDRLVGLLVGHHRIPDLRGSAHMHRHSPASDGAVHRRTQMIGLELEGCESGG